ncbi:coenzyme F420-0:L-glutamate ligase [Candidatus Saccharibacteria bacterium]|nr:coenzyme F420-0:L-glutamate ligase [Candidatus Saccharibacteria bacterium]
MLVRPLKTKKILPGAQSMVEVLDESLEKVEEKNILVVTSKIVALCEGRAVPIKGNDKEELIKQEADYYLPRRSSKWNFEFTITKKTLIMSAGIDESNTNGNYLLWPKDPQKSVNEIRSYLKKRFSLETVGVIITDSSCTPMRWGTVGVPIAYSGFEPKKNYIGTKDLFGYTLKVSQSNIAGGLAAAAVVTMGEGKEQTPLALISDIPFVSFLDHDPTQEELDQYFIGHKEDDLFEPFLSSVKWLPGKNK